MATPFPFGSGNVLTAAQMNAITTLPVSTKTASHTLTIADLGTRVVMNSASATTITVNTSIFGASDKVEILNIGAGVCTVTAGTCTVGTTGTLALAQNAGGTLTFISASASVFTASGVTATASGLTLISTTTIGSGVSSVTVSNAFSATYDNYKVIVNGGVSSALSTWRLTFGATATGYYYAWGAYTYAGAAVNQSGANAAYVQYLAGGSGNNNNGNFDVYNPFLAKNTGYSGPAFQYNTGEFGGFTAGFLNDSTSYTAFTLTPGSGTITGGTIRVYGYQNS